MSKILIIEDEETIRLGLRYYLEQEKFEVLESNDGISIEEKIKESDLVLLDINLPIKNGYEIFKEIKKVKEIPIIFLTANDLELSIVKGLDMGADDYITKPFRARELVSRLNTVLRRNNSSNIIKINNITIDLNQAKVLKGSEDVLLTSLEYKILLTLVLNPNKVFTREKILSDIWDVNEDYVNDNTLTVYIKRIREKIEEDSTNPKIIKTVRGLGYVINIW